jgi:hypothetical protein
MNTAVVVPHLGLSQIGFYSIKAINELIAQKHTDDFVIFFEQITMPILQPQCATMCINELMSFKGNIITSTIDNTAMTLARNSRSKNKVILYLWDLEWMRAQKHYEYVYQVLNSVHKIYARSLEHSFAIANYRGRPVDGVLEEFNITEMIK